MQSFNVFGGVMGTINRVSDILLATTLPGEAPAVINTDSLSLSVSRQSPGELQGQLSSRSVSGDQSVKTNQ